MEYIFYQKKQNRKKILFGSLSSDGQKLLSKEDEYLIISETEYKEMIDNKIFNPYKENDIFSAKFVIKRDKNLLNNKLSIVGLGPYTLNYRKKILSDLKILKTEMEEYDVEIISDKEIYYIENIFKIVDKALHENGYLDKTIEKELIFGKVKSDKNEWKFS